MNKEKELLYNEAISALGEKKYEKAVDLLNGVLHQDQDYLDAKELLSKAIRLKRQRRYIKLLGFASITIVLLIVFIIISEPKGNSPSSVIPETTTPSVSATVIFTATIIPSASPTPSPTPIAMTWTRISEGQEFSRDNITSIVVDPDDPDTLYIGMENAGVYKSIDGGESWTPISNGLLNTQIRSMVIDYENPQILYAGTPGGVFQTNDGGDSWRSISKIPGIYLLMDPENSSTLYLCDGWDIYESKNQGRNWEKIYSDSACHEPIEDLKIDPENGNVLGIAINGGIWPCLRGVYQSTDSGRNWTRLGITTADELVIVKNSDGRRIFFACGDNHTWSEGQGMFISADEGNTWEYRKVPCFLLETNPSDPSRVYAGTKNGGILTSSLSGGGLNLSLTNEIVTAIHADKYNGQDRIIVGVEKQGLYISVDGGKSWTHHIDGVGSTYIGLKIDNQSGGNYYAYNQYNKTSCSLYRSSDSGVTWKEILFLETNLNDSKFSWCNPSIDYQNNLYVIQKSTFTKSKTQGNSWDYLSIPVTTTNPYSSRWISANPYVPDLVYMIFNNDSTDLYYSENLGKSWEQSSGTSDLRNNEVNKALFFAEQGQIVYGEWLRSADAGRSWTSCNVDFTRNSNSDTFMVIDPTDSKNIMVATSGLGILKGLFSCSQWDERNNGIENPYTNTIAVDKIDPKIYYVGTNTGAYITFDSGLSWHEINEGFLGTRVIYSIVVDSDNQVYASTPHGIFQLERK